MMKEWVNVLEKIPAGNVFWQAFTECPLAIRPVTKLTDSRINTRAISVTAQDSRFHCVSAQLTHAPYSVDIWNGEIICLKAETSVREMSVKIYLRSKKHFCGQLLTWTWLTLWSLLDIIDFPHKIYVSGRVYSFVIVQLVKVLSRKSLNWINCFNKLTIFYHMPPTDCTISSWLIIYCHDKHADD